MGKAAKPKSEKDPIDVMIGQHLRILRSSLGITQDGLAEKLELSPQQVQKYETGENRIYASRLYHIAKLLNRDVSYFFKEREIKNLGLYDQSQDEFSYESDTNDILEESEVKTLLRAYSRIDDKKKRKVAMDMIRSLAS